MNAVQRLDGRTIGLDAERIRGPRRQWLASAVSGSAGMGGNASSALDVADKDAASLTATVEAGGGTGGGTDNGKAGAGGDAVARLTTASTRLLR